MIINRDRILVAAGHALAVVPGVFVPGVPWWVVACAFAGAFCSTLAHLPHVISPAPLPTKEP